MAPTTIFSYLSLGDFLAAAAAGVPASDGATSDAPASDTTPTLARRTLAALADSAPLAARLRAACSVLTAESRQYASVALAPAVRARLDRLPAAWFLHSPGAGSLFPDAALPDSPRSAAAALYRCAAFLCGVAREIAGCLAALDVRGAAAAAARATPPRVHGRLLALLRADAAGAAPPPPSPARTPHRVTLSPAPSPRLPGGVGSSTLRRFDRVNGTAPLVGYRERPASGSPSAQRRLEASMHYDVSRAPFAATIAFRPRNASSSSLDEDGPAALSSVCTPQSFPPSPLLRTHVMAVSSAFADDVLFAARDALRVEARRDADDARPASAPDPEIAGAEESASAKPAPRPPAFGRFSADDKAAGVELRAAGHVALKVLLLLLLYHYPHATTPPH